MLFIYSVQIMVCTNIIGLCKGTTLWRGRTIKAHTSTAFLPLPVGFPSALPFPTPSLTLPAFAFYYSSEVIVLKARGMRYISLYKFNFIYLRFSQEWLLFLSSLEALPEAMNKTSLNDSDRQSDKTRDKEHTLYRSLELQSVVCSV